MTITEIYAEYSVGSPGFIDAVQTHCGYDMTDSEIEAIASQARTADEFDKIWNDGGNWCAAW